MDDVMQRRAFGWATLDPCDDVVAGSYGMWRLCYVVGSKGIANGGRVRVYTDSDTDWGIPQFDDPAGEDFCTVASPQGAHVSATTCGYRGLELVVVGRALKDGERCASVSLHELLDGPRVIEIGPLGRRLTVSLAPEPETCEVTFAHTDLTPHLGINAYWLRVIQVDMEMAWTSPVFVDYVSSEKE